MDAPCAAFVKASSQLSNNYLEPGPSLGRIGALWGRNSNPPTADQAARTSMSPNALAGAGRSSQSTFASGSQRSVHIKPWMGLELALATGCLKPRLAAHCPPRASCRRQLQSERQHNMLQHIRYREVPSYWSVTSRDAWGCVALPNRHTHYSLAAPAAECGGKRPQIMMHGNKYQSGGVSVPWGFPYFAGPGALRDLQRLEQQTYAAGDSSVGGTPEEQIRLTELSNMWHEEDHSATSPFGAVTASAVLNLYRLPGAAVGYGQGDRPRCPAS